MTAELGIKVAQSSYGTHAERKVAGVDVREAAHCRPKVERCGGKDAAFKVAAQQWIVGVQVLEVLMVILMDARGP